MLRESQRGRPAPYHPMLKPHTQKLVRPLEAEPDDSGKKGYKSPLTGALFQLDLDLYDLCGLGTLRPADDIEFDGVAL